MRGAGHIHGVIWVDWDKFSVLPQRDIENIKSALEKIKEEEVLSESEKQALADFADLFISCSLKDPRTEKIVRSVNMHHHTKTCRNYCTKCRFYFPRFPSLKTMVAVPIRMVEKDPEKQKEVLERVNLVKKKVMDILQDDDKMKEIQNIRSQDIEEWKKESCIKSTLAMFKRERLIALLRMANLSGETDQDLIDVYENALSVSEVGYKIILERDVDEIYVNNYNPEWIICWNGNIDIQFCFDIHQ